MHFAKLFSSAYQKPKIVNVKYRSIQVLRFTEKKDTFIQIYNENLLQYCREVETQSSGVLEIRSSSAVLLLET